jgi:hypothetical protein
LEPSLTWELLRTELHYDPETGKWTWLTHRKGRRRAGPGTTYKQKNGYWFRSIKLFGKSYKTSRLAYFYMTGAWPENEIDHEDRDPLNDRWLNLRPATRQQNNANRRPFSEWNTTTLPGGRPFAG